MSGATIQGWLAFVLVLVTGVAWVRRIRAVAIPADPIPFVAFMAAGAILGALGLANGAGWVGGVPAALAIALGGIFCATVAIAPQRGGTGRFHVGRPLPDFEAPDENGTRVALSGLRGRPLLLKFFRGHW